MRASPVSIKAWPISTPPAVATRANTRPANYPNWISLRLIFAPVAARRAVNARERVARLRSWPQSPRNSGVSTPSKRTVVSNYCPSHMVARTIRESRADSGGIISRRQNRHIAGTTRAAPWRTTCATSRHRKSNFLVLHTDQSICTYRMNYCNITKT